MKLKTSFFNRGIIVNNFKRFGWIGIVYTLALFFSVPLQILMHYNNIEKYNSIHNPITNIFLFRSEIQKLFILVIPVLAAVLLIRYLHVKKSVDLFHALPLKRENLYNSHILTGILLLVVPVIITAIVSWILCFTLNLGNFYTAKDLYIWAGITCLMNIVIFLFGILVGMITGISAVQGLLTYIFLFLPVGLSVLLFHNIETLVYGFLKDYFLDNKIIYLSPISRVLDLGNGEKIMHFNEVTIYIIISLVLYFLAKYLYSRRKLESASESIAFRELQPIFKYGVTFCTMLVGGIYFWETQHDIYWLLFGYFASSIIGYFLAEIVIKKSLKVFGSIKGYVIYAAVIIFILLGVNFDITGYERYVPPLQNVDSIYLGRSLYQYNLDEPGKKTNFYFNETNLKNIEDFHKQIIKDKSKNKYSNHSNRQIVFVYKLKNGDEISRGYHISQEDYGQYFKPIYESHEYKKMHYGLLSINPRDIDKITISPKGRISKKAVITDPAHIQQAVEILQEEINNLTYEEMIAGPGAWADIDILLANDNRIRMQWEKTYTKFEKWLEKQGYLKQARIMPEEVAYAVIEKRNEKDNRTFMEEKITVEEKNKSGKTLKIVEKSKIEICLRKYSEKWSKYEKYMLRFYSENNDLILHGNIAGNNAPDFIVEYFQ